MRIFLGSKKFYVLSNKKWRLWGKKIGHLQPSHVGQMDCGGRSLTQSMERIDEVNWCCTCRRGDESVDRFVFEL